MKRIYIISSIIVIILAVIIGVLGWSIWNDQRVEDSKNETALLSRDQVDPIVVDDSSNTEQDDMATDTQNIEDMNPEMSVSALPEAPEQPPIGPIVSKTGQWSGRGSYSASGNARVVTNGDRIIVELGEDFAFTSNAPDAVVYISSQSNPTNVRGAKLLGEISVPTSGNAAWEITQEELDTYGGSIVIWCKAFDVMMAVAQYE